MWRLTGGLDWETIAQLSQKWANRYELTLAKDFVDRLSSIPEGESGRILFQIVGTDAASEFMAADLAGIDQGQDRARASGGDRGPIAAGSAGRGLPGAA